MRIPVDTMFVAVAVAVCLVGVSTHVERSGITTKLPCSLSAGGSEVATERQLRGQETEQDDEERTFSPEHIENWLTTNKLPADVVKLMAFDKAENVLRDPDNFADLGKFLREFNVKNPESRTSFIKVLTTHHGEKGVFQIIEAAKQVPVTASLATRLQEEQLHYWLGAKKEPKDVFAIMELDKAGDELFKKPLMITCVKYVNMFNEEHPDKAKTVLSLLHDYDQKRLVRMLIAAKEVPSTEQLAVRVQAELTSSWLKQKKPPAEIFSLIGLDNVEGNLFEIPLFAAWMKYVDDYKTNSKNVQKVDVLKIFKDHYMKDYLDEMPIEMGHLAIDLKRDLQERWFREGTITPKTVGKYVESLKPVMGSTLLRALEDYDMYFQRRQKQQTRQIHQIHHIDYGNKFNDLKEKYKEPEVLAKMILKESVNSKTGKTSWEMLEALLLHWIDKRVEPNTVHKWLRVEDTAANGVIEQLYNNYKVMYKEVHDAPPTKRLKTTHSER